MYNRKSLMFSSLFALTAVACTPEDTDKEDEVGLRVSAALQVLPETGSIEFRLTPAMCRPGDDKVPGDSFVFGVDIKMWMLADGSVFDELAADDYDASMLLAEDLLAVPPGCYTFIALPITKSGTPVAGCTPETRDVVITDGLITDLDLVIECGEEPREEVDVNQPPTIDMIKVSDQVSACEATRICATASDPDFDMLDFTWDLSSLGSAVPGTAALVSHHLDENRALTQCIVVRADEAGTYDIGLTVHDVTRFIDDSGALTNPIRIEDHSGVESHASEIISLDATLGCDPVGRSAVVMLTLDNDPGMGEADARQLIGNLVEWVTYDATAKSRVLVVLDDSHHGEDVGDAEFVASQLRTLGYDVTSELETRDGLPFDHIETFDVVWFVNPGHPMDDAQTHTALLRYRNMGGGLILQGDDMADFWGAPDFMQPLTYLDWQNNGTMSCGRMIDNNQGASYKVEFETGDHPILNGLAGMGFEYGNDIDHSIPLGMGEKVLAWGRYVRGECEVRTPVVVALEPDDLMAWGE